ncbi:GNAT family N-acetyltransferase [Glutamicibacter endophyticus]
MPAQRVLHAADLTLRPPQTSDAPSIAEACRDELTQQGIVLPRPYGVTEAQQFITRAGELRQAGEEYSWAILRDAEVVGMMSLHPQSSHVAELGYWSHPRYRRRGYLRTAALEVLAHAFDAEGLGVQRILWRAFTGNLGSAALARALGFRLIGETRRSADWHGQCRDEWWAELLHDQAPSPESWKAVFPQEHSG